MREALYASVLIVPLLFGGCASSSVTKAERADHPRDPQLATELTHRGTALIADDPAEAATLLREALEADLYYGPAHNNLGIIYLNAGKLYEAAEEFDWARRLMPGHPDPRINLGLALERGGKIDEAFDAYGSAIEVMPGYLPAVQALARMNVRRGVVDERTDSLLRDIRIRGSAEWQQWATQWLLR